MDLNKKYYSIDYDILLKEGTEEEQMMVLKENPDLACKFLLGSKYERDICSSCSENPYCMLVKSGRF